MSGIFCTSAGLIARVPLIAASSDCRAVDVLDILVQSRRNKKAADRFFRKLFKQYGQPRVLVTDKLRSYGEVQIAPPCAMLSFRT